MHFLFHIDAIYFMQHIYGSSPFSIDSNATFNLEIELPHESNCPMKFVINSTKIKYRLVMLNLIKDNIRERLK